MAEYVFMNGEYVEADKAVIPVRTHAFLYGTSVFEELTIIKMKTSCMLSGLKNITKDFSEVQKLCG